VGDCAVRGATGTLAFVGANQSTMCHEEKRTLPFVAGPTEPPLVKNVETVLLRIANQRFAFHIQVEVHKLPPNPGTLHSFPAPKE
jgi:hypothetical protein